MTEYNPTSTELNNGDVLEFQKSDLPRNAVEALTHEAIERASNVAEQKDIVGHGHEEPFANDLGKTSLHILPEGPEDPAAIKEMIPGEASMMILSIGRAVDWARLNAIEDSEKAA